MKYTRMNSVAGYCSEERARIIPKTDNPSPLINIPATRGKTSPYSALDCSNLSVLSGAKSKPRPMSTRYDPKYSRLNLVLFMFTSHTRFGWAKKGRECFQKTQAERL